MDEHLLIRTQSLPPETAAQKYLRENRELLYKLLDASRTLDRVGEAYHAADKDARRFIDIDGAREVKEDLVIQIAGTMCPAI